MQKKAFGKVKLCRDTRLEENNLFALKIMDKTVLKKKRQGAPLVTPSPLGACAAVWCAFTYRSGRRQG